MSKNPSVQVGGESAPEGPVLPPDCRTETLGVAFFDLSRITAWASIQEDAQVAGFLQEFYALSAGRLAPAGARIVKFMGDAGLAVFPTESAEKAIFALCDLAAESRRCGQRHGLDTHLNVNVHVGPVLVVQTLAIVSP